MQEKLTLDFHISTLSPESLANQIFSIQKFPGLSQEIDYIQEQISVCPEDFFTDTVTTKNQSVSTSDVQELKNRKENYSKKMKKK